MVELIVYTQTGALSFNIVKAADKFADRIAAALEEGTVVLDTAEGTKLVLCAVNVVAVEIREDTPPVEKI